MPTNDERNDRTSAAARPRSSRVGPGAGKLRVDQLYREAVQAGLSHDLRSPLGAILTYVDLLREDYHDALAPAGQEFVGRIASSARNALAMLEALQSLQAISEEELDCTELDIRGLAGEVFDSVRAGEHEASARSVEWRAEPIPKAWADPPMMRVALTHLIANAVKFTRPRADARIVLSAERDAGGCVYSLRDNGVGFDPAHADAVFKLFTRLHPAEEFAGRGVGLTVARAIVQRHAGEMWAHGEVGAGATVSFWLPDLAVTRNDA